MATLPDARSRWLGMLLLACSQSAPEPPPLIAAPSAGATAAGSAGAMGGAAQIAANGGASAIGGVGGTNLTLPSASGSAGSAGSAETCSATFARTELQTVSLAFAFDVSGSMGKLDKPYHDPTLKWQPVVRASKAFFADASSTHLRASLTFFPAADERCEADSYLRPDVAMTDLPSESFASAIDAVTPMKASEWRGGTPTLAVLEGTFAFLQEQASEDANSKYAVVLLTDGYPQDCDDDEVEIETVAAAIEAVAATFPTYVIGVANPAGGPDTVSNLNRLAQAGRTDSAMLVATGDPEKTAHDLTAAIDSIRGRSTACQAPIPEHPQGAPLDPQRVNVTYSRAGAVTRLGYDASCVSEDAWRFDDALAPRAIVLCDATCAAVQRDPALELNVEFGCERVEAAPR